MGRFDDIRWKWLEERGIEVYGDPYQLDYMLSLWKPEDLVKNVFGLGQAGTGKTTLAVLAGAYEVEKGTYKRIRYVRNAVPVRNQGFVKGDPQEKDAPYMQPLKDALELVHPATFEKWSEDYVQKIKAHSTAFIQGSTWDNEFIIFDEIQNWDLVELQSGMTRVGRGSKLVITGSHRQVVNRKIKRYAGLLPYEVYMEHFKGDPRIMFHELKTVYRGWFAEKADSVDETIKRLMEEKRNELGG